jgi:GTP-binding protein
MTKGTGILNHSFLDYKPYAGEISRLRSGVLVNLESGVATPYSLENFYDRGIFFVEPGTKIYQGMIVGEATRPQDIELNLTREKQLTNMRAAGSDDLIQLKVPKKVILEEALTYINEDELVEITPQNIRLRKKSLDGKQRKKEAKV